MLSHARINSKSVRGAAKGSRVAVAGGGGAGAICEGSLCGGGSATAGVSTSRVSNTVSFPDMRKIPPPTRPADFASRTCLASLNDVGVGFDTSDAGGFGVVNFPSGDGADADGVEGVWETRRELIGFSRRSLLSLVGWVIMGG